MAQGRSPSATVLLLRQCLACGRDSIFAVFGAQWMQVLQYVITCQEVMTVYVDGQDLMRLKTRLRRFRRGMCREEFNWSSRSGYT
jgi:hypothetical protein